MRDGFLIADADRHVIEPFEMWREYLPPPLRAHAPYQPTADDPQEVAERAGRLGTRALLPVPPMPMLAGRPLFHKMSERAWLELAWSAHRRSRGGGRDELERPETHLREMDREGIDVAFLLPTYALLILGHGDLAPELALGFARAYNEWLRGFCALDPTRLRAVALACPHAPEKMAGELSAEGGTAAVVLRPNPVGGRRLGHPAYRDFWAECERLSIGVLLHEGTHAYLPTAGADRFDSRFALHACSHPLEQMMAIVDLIEGGVLERHPALRVAFLEAGCGWLPYWLWRLDQEHAHLAGEVEERVRLRPSAYFRRQCLVAMEPDEPLAAEVMREIGEDRFLFGTDFPHLEHDEGQVERALALRGRVPEGALRKLLWDNAARFFRIEAPGQQQQENG